MSSTTVTEHPQFTKIDSGDRAEIATFSMNGEYLITGHSNGVRVWRLKDGKQMAKMDVGDIQCLAVSKNGRWIAAGTERGCAAVWDATTYEAILACSEPQWGYLDDDLSHGGIRGVDFSPDSARLLVAPCSGTVTIWDLATRERIQILHHWTLSYRFRAAVRMVWVFPLAVSMFCCGCITREEAWYGSTHYPLRVVAAKYSQQGDQIATATHNFVRIWNSNNSRLLVKINVEVIPRYNTGILWSSSHLFVVSNNIIKQFDASTGSILLQWSVDSVNRYSCISLPRHMQFIVYFVGKTTVFWDMETHMQLGLIKHREEYPIALSPDDRFLVVQNDRKIILKGLSHITNLIPFSRLYSTFVEPDIEINDAVLDLWKQDQLTNVDVLLTGTIRESQNPSHYVLASRSLVRARLGLWDAALIDAEMASNAQLSVISCIAESVAHAGKGERDKAYQICELVCEQYRSSHGTFLLLIKAIIVFMAGEHHDAMSRVEELISANPLNWVCHVVQANIHLFLGNLHMEHVDYDHAIQSFECAIRSHECAPVEMQHNMSRPFSVVSLITGWKSDDLGVTVRRRLCEALYAAGRPKDVEYFHRMINDLGGLTNMDSEHLGWAIDFSQRFIEKSEQLGDEAVNAQRYDDAIFRYTTALSLNPLSPQGILVKRNKAFVTGGTCKQALETAKQSISLDPSSPWGYELKHLGLHKAGDYGKAIDAFEVMLSKIAKSPHQDIRQYGDRYISPSSIRATIHTIVNRTIRHLPRVLIDTTTGRLHDRAELASAFESQPIVEELVSSMTTRVDYIRIKHEVRQYFRYVMLSHKWEMNEPLFQLVRNATVYKLDKSPTHNKLQMFCKTVRVAGFNWAWSDTCCIDKSDHFVLQEALVAMFKWYEGSAMTIIFLRGVRSSSLRGSLANSIWNTRAWTLQEYIASKVICVYTEDWTPYLSLTSPNHKISLEIISEMEEATGVSAQQLLALRPGLTGIREKLRLASTRHTTLVEDAAYSLLGIFSVVGISAIYGEGEASLGRLLAHVLAGSGDVSILAWMGESGSFNSCLPAHIGVFSGSATSYLPLLVPETEVESTISSPHSSFDLDVAVKLYERLNELPPPWFAASRMKLPCIAFPLSPFIESHRTRSGRIYRTETLGLGMVEIRTRHDLSRMNSLYLVHPWLDALLEREGKSSAIAEEDIPPHSPNTDDKEISDEEIDDGYTSLSEPKQLLLPPPVSRAPIDKKTRARQLVARLRQPFGALLLTLAGMGGRSVDYRRVAADSLITVQIQEDVSLVDILDHVCTLDVL